VGAAEMDDAVRSYIDAIAPEHRPLFDRLDRLVLRLHPEADRVLSYKMPTYRVGRRRLHIGVWKHGVSLYGWPQGQGAEFSARHPEARTSRAPYASAPLPRPPYRMTNSRDWCAPPWVSETWLFFTHHALIS
jgi:hypothetical protein